MCWEEPSERPWELTWKTVGRLSERREKTVRRLWEACKKIARRQRKDCCLSTPYKSLVATGKLHPTATVTLVDRIDEAASSAGSAAVRIGRHRKASELPFAVSALISNTLRQSSTVGKRFWLRLLPESRLQVGTAAEQLERLHSRHSRRFSHRQMQPKNSPHPFNRSDRSRSVYGEPERAEECQRTVEGTSERERVCYELVHKLYKQLYSGRTIGTPACTK